MTTIRIDEETREKVRRLSCEMGLSMQEVLSRAVEAYRREWLLDQVNDYYAALRSDPSAWAEELDERRTWDAVLMDRLSDDPYPLDPDQIAEAEAVLAKRARGGAAGSKDS